MMMMMMMIVIIIVIVMVLLIIKKQMTTLELMTSYIRKVKPLEILIYIIFQFITQCELSVISL